MYEYILLSNYDNKVTPISETLTWTTFDKAKKFSNLIEAEEFFETIQLDFSGYFTIGVIIKEGTYNDLGYHWENDTEYLYLKSKERVIKKIPNKTVTMEPDEKMKELLLDFAEKGLNLVDNFMREINKAKK
jgi:hypothetical protein